MISVKSAFYPYLKKTALIIFLILLGGLGLKAYVKSCIKGWSNEQQVELSIQKWYIRWRTKGPELILKNVTASNKIPWESLQKIFVEEASLELNLFATFKNYFRIYEVFIQLKDMKLEDKTNSYLEVKNCRFLLYRDYSVYKIKEIKASMLDIALSREYVVPTPKPEKQPVFHHFFLYLITGGIEYDIKSKIWKVDLHIPPAKNQMPEETTYRVDANGYLNVLSMPWPLPPKKTPIPLQGLIKITINNFSHFLAHLHRAKLISIIIENVGSIVGYPLPKEYIQLGKKEIFTNAVTLDFKVQPEALYIESFKIYP